MCSAPQLRMTMGLKEMCSKNLYMSHADMWERKQDCKVGEGGVILSVTLKKGRTSWSALSSVPARRTRHIFALMKNALDIINFKFSILSF